MKISFITTIYNESQTIENFLDSLLAQTQLPSEVIIVDGDSSDGTIEKINKYETKFKKKKVDFILLQKKGNRSIGRNEAIRHASGNIIACSDAGNTLDKSWIKNISKPFSDKSVDVVAGYYQGKAQNIFQKCLIPYTLVMPDQVDAKTFLPATRSVAFKKAVWKKVKGFDEQFSHNEDYVFANRLKEIGAKTVFVKDAIVYWVPRRNLREAFVMFFRFALGDAEAKIFRPKVLLLFLRYFIFFYLIGLSLLYKSFLGFSFLILSALLYILWSIKKNYHYVKAKAGFYILPSLQFTADLAVFFGTSMGIAKSIKNFSYSTYIKNNKFLLFIALFYTTCILIMLPWGVPNVAHPFPYHMDEWHQLMALKAILKSGTTTIAGAAQIPFLYPLLSGIYLLPFFGLTIIDPFSIKTPLDNLVMQGRLFEILRSVNILFGVGSIMLIANIAKKYFKSNIITAVYFFTISPLLILLSGYFKYDIGLLFFIILSLNLLYRFGKSPTLRNYLYASIACALAFSVKFSAIPLLVLLIFAFFWFVPNKKREYHFLLFGIGCYLLTFILIGSPNILFGLADYRELLYSNLVSYPATTGNFITPYPWWGYLTLNHFPMIFGHIAYILSIISFFFVSSSLLWRNNWRKVNNKNTVYLVVAYVLFIISVVPLKIGAMSNRVLVFLPFIALFISIFVTQCYRSRANKFYKYCLGSLILLLMIGQFVETSIWMYTKFQTDTQKTSSLWIEKHIPVKSNIGIEAIPIYQYLPNIIVKEFYREQYALMGKNKLQYQLVSAETKLPKYIVISNGNIETSFLKKSSKKDLLEAMKKKKYKEVAVFSPDLRYYKLIGNEEDYYFAGLITSPVTISIYKSQ